MDVFFQLINRMIWGDVDAGLLGIVLDVELVHLVTHRDLARGEHGKEGAGHIADESH